MLVVSLKYMVLKWNKSVALNCLRLLIGAVCACGDEKYDVFE